jgi:hypothetical protein
MKKIMPKHFKQEFNHDALTISQIMPISDGANSSKLLLKLRLPYEVQERINNLYKKEINLMAIF